MKGRLEHELQIKETITGMLLDLPQEVTDFYYNIQISREPTTCREYVKKLRHFWTWYQTHYPGKQITGVDDTVIGRYFENIKYKKSATGEIAKTSAQYNKLVWTALNQFFSFLVTRGSMSQNPMALTQRPNKQDVVKRQFLSFEELNGILDMVKKGALYQSGCPQTKTWIARDMLIMTLFMNTGMRRTALSEINVDDISFEDMTITVTDKRDKTQIYIITPQIKKAIEDWLPLRAKILKDTKSDALFINKYKTRLSDKAMYRLVEEYSQIAIGKAISPHKLRASFIALYYEASGNDIQATCEAVGHASIATTSIYISKRNDSRKQAMEFMGKNLNTHL